MEYPSISCKCITYGRVDFLEESLASFLKQEYPGKKELVIVNDYPLQKLHFDHPEVRIINLDETFPVIGEKENFATEQCQYDVIAQWDDDDVALPNHLLNIATWFKSDTALLHWANGVYFNVPNITALTFLGNSGIVFSKKAWKEIGGHPLENAGYDMTFVETLHRRFPNNVVMAHPDNKDVSWFYIWGGRGYHMSGLGHDKGDKPNIVIRHQAFIEQERRKGRIPTGDIQLQSHWKQDYKHLLQKFISQ